MMDLVVLFSAIAVEFASIVGTVWLLDRWRGRRDERAWNSLGH